MIAALTAGSLFLLINYNQVLVGAVKQYVAPGNVVTTPVIVEPNTSTTVGSKPRIIIPKIGVDAPVVYDEPRVDEPSYQKALERGVVRLGNTADPGTNGNVVIGGHSSNNVFNAGDYKYVFVNLKRLDVGDVFYLNFEGKRYTYKVTVAKKIISPTDVSALASDGRPIVTLFTCDPPGTNVNRLIVQAEQVDPDPNQASASNKKVDYNETNPLPSVAPSLWDRIRQLLSGQ
jgi:sortase A